MDDPWLGRDRRLVHILKGISTISKVEQIVQQRIYNLLQLILRPPHLILNSHRRFVYVPSSERHGAETTFALSTVPSQNITMASTSISPYSLLPSLLPLSSPCFPTLSTRRPCRPLLVGRKPHPISASSPKNNPDNTTTNGSWVSPDWLTSLVRSLALGRGDDSGIPIANAKLEDVSDLLGGALFLPLFKWMLEYGPVYRLAAGPRDFVVVSDPAIAKHVLRNYGKYAKGLVSEVSEFLFGSGFAVAEGPLWTVSALRCYSLFITSGSMGSDKET
ncbi:hypothetical protein B296_00037272 [Ensete ventricosum]|uniref:Cytochrome P450 n=1 Tax=Ensete ventricosum TaxID=4639 RepID=A0A427A035_ENSVE|nr:hypothetical protein B296_00037272 [Ensete ventricosum]